MMKEMPTPIASRRTVLIGGLALALSGCSASSLIGPSTPVPDLYVIHPEFGPIPDAPVIRQQVVVAVPTASETLDTERIALERAPNIMDYYAHAQWTDRLPLLIQSLLVEAFENSGRIAGVAREAAGIRADVVLEIELRHFEAYYAVQDTPPEIHVALVPKLVGALHREVIGATEITRSARATANDMARITAAFTVAGTDALKETVRWTLLALASRNGTG
jgi:cholesterol transport system auxiliary component